MATSMDTLPAHLLPLVMEEFPQSLATACVCRAGQREPRLRCVQCGIIEEEEEDCSTLEEDQALRSFLQTVESLRRSTRWADPKGVLARLWHVWPIWLPYNPFGPTGVYSVMDADCADMKPLWVVVFSPSLLENIQYMPTWQQRLHWVKTLRTLCYHRASSKVLAYTYILSTLSEQMTFIVFNMCTALPSPCRTAICHEHD